MSELHNQTLERIVGRLQPGERTLVQLGRSLPTRDGHAHESRNALRMGLWRLWLDSDGIGGRFCHPSGLEVS